MIALHVLALTVDDEVEIIAFDRPGGGFTRQQPAAVFKYRRKRDCRCVFRESPRNDPWRSNRVLDADEAASVPVESIHARERVVRTRIHFQADTAFELQALYAEVIGNE